MIVIIEDDIFNSPRSGLALQSLLHLGFEGQHRLQTAPPFEPEADFAVNRWLAGLSQILREEAELALKAGMEREALGLSADLSIRVSEVQSPNWDAPIPRLPLTMAVRFLQKPLRVILENWHNDGAFLRAVPPSPWRKELHTNLERGWIAVEHGGGSDMKSRLERADREESLRLWTLFDSDALEPGVPSKAQETLRQCCSDRAIAHHRLERRAIENYLPVKALEAWVVRSPGKLREPRRRAVAGFAAMRPEQRHHYNMKRGFAGDRRRSESIPSLFDDVVDRRELQNGIDEEIASLFHQEHFQILEVWLEKDGQHRETREMVESILRRL